MGATDTRAPVGFAPIAIGLALTLIHLISIPVTNTSVNPARSTGVALIAGGWAAAQLWLFWVAPIVGGAAGGLHLSVDRRQVGLSLDSTMRAARCLPALGSWLACQSVGAAGSVTTHKS